MIHLFVACFLALLSSFWGSPNAEVVESAPLAEKGAFQSDVVADPLIGIWIVGRSEKVEKEPKELNGVQSSGVVLLSENPGFLKRLQEEFVGRTLTQGALWKLKADIADFYSAKGQPFVIVSIPRQPVTNGVLRVVVEEATLGNITVQGNEYYNPSQIKNYINAKSGSPIDGRQLLKDLARLNQNPFRRTDAIFRPGKKVGTADLELATIDRWPYRFYMGADNTGTDPTDRDRFFSESISAKRSSKTRNFPTNSPVLPIGTGSIRRQPFSAFLFPQGKLSSLTAAIHKYNPNYPTETLKNRKAGKSMAATGSPLLRILRFSKSSFSDSITSR